MEVFEMATIGEKRAQRRAFLIELYKATDGDPFQDVNVTVVGAGIGVDDETASAIAKYLVDEGLAEFPSLGPYVAITSAGVRQAEDWLEEDENQAPAADVAVVLITAEQRRSLEPVLDEIQQLAHDLPADLDPDVRADVEAQVATVQAQMLSPAPRHRIVAEALHSVRAVGEGAVGGVVGTGLMLAIGKALSIIG